MTTADEWKAWREKENAFLAAPIGAAFNKFKNAHARMWKEDSNDSISNKRLREITEEAKVAEKAFRDELDKLMGSKNEPA